MGGDGRGGEPLGGCRSAGAALESPWSALTASSAGNSAVTSAVASSGPLLTKELSGIRLEDTDLDHHAHPVRMYVADADLLTASSRAVQHPRAARSHRHDAITASGPSLPARGPPWNPDSALTRWRQMTRRNAECPRRVAGNGTGPGGGGRPPTTSRLRRLR